MLLESRFEALRTATTPLIGRDEEIELLMRRWTQAKSGEGCVVLISGEPGIGKSRIAESLHERLSTELHTRVRFFCSPHHQDSALYPAISQLERAAGFRREDTTEQRLTKLEELLAQATNEFGTVAPLFADLLSIPTGERYPALALTPQKRKEKTLQALAAQAEGLALQHPVLIVFEDVHWADPTTCELLDLLIDRVPKMRVLVLITYRPEFSPTWIGLAHVALMTLSRLPPRHRSEMITLMTGGKALPREITDQIVERTDGIPLFIEELTKTVIESGIVADAGGRYALAGPASIVEIPTSLHASLLARLDRLAPTREIAQIAATIGRSFSHELISVVAQMPLEKLDEGLEQLVRAELIFKHGTPPNAEYSFKHALVQDAAYSTLLRATRRQLHARIASTLETEFVDIVARHPAVLAQHCTGAGLNEKAMGYWLKAGQQSVARSAMGEAVAQFQKGLDLLRNLPHTALHQKQELDLRVSSIPALIGTRGYSSQDVGETITHASALAEQLNKPEYVAPLLYGSWVFNLVRAELKLALTPAKEMERMGEKDHAWRLLGYGEQGIIRFFLGALDAARTLFEKSAGMYAVVRHGIRASVESYSIKKLEPLYDFQRTVGLSDASALMAKVQACLELGDLDGIGVSERTAVEGYNRDDCFSAWRLRDWLERVRSQLIEAGTAIDRPSPKSGDVGEDLTDWQQKIALLVGRLTHGVPVEKEEQTAEQRARWILAHVLDWHRREDKAAWWEYFRLSDLSADDLLDERAGLSGLALLGTVGGTAKAPIHRYSFPPQDTDLRGGEDLRMLGGEKFGRVEAISSEDRTVDIKKRRDTADVHPEAVFAHQVVDTQVLADALVRIGEHVAANGMLGNGPYQAARDLLMVAGPRTGGEGLKGEDEASLTAAMRIAPHLSGGVFPIQGPPGAGKTHIGARMICVLAQRGKRVGVTANSHKVIRNLLDEVIEAAEELGISVQCIQKVTEEESDLPRLQFTTDNAALFGAIGTSCQVAGGTAWLWARPEAFQSVDVLFIDEAAQMSLANVLAVSQAAAECRSLGGSETA